MHTSNVYFVDLSVCTGGSSGEVLEFVELIRNGRAKDMNTVDAVNSYESGSSFDPEFSVVLPCLNEAETIGLCIRKALQSAQALGITVEVVVADNGSSDGSQSIAKSLGARLVHVTERGYGSALRHGIAAARGQYVIMADADDSYALDNLRPFVDALRNGFQVVVGNRFLGGIRPGAMPILHRYFGNPVLSFLGRRFFRCSIGDFHCGMRGFVRQAIIDLGLRTSGMEFASEMIVRAVLSGLSITEVPTQLSPDGRTRRPHLRKWRDGWRHLRFLLLYSPRWLFLYPGVALTTLGTSALVWLFPSARQVGGVRFDLQTMLFAATAVIVGSAAISFALLSKVLAVSQGLLHSDERLTRFLARATLERGLGVGMVLSVLGVSGLGIELVRWSNKDFGSLDVFESMRLSIVAAVLLIVGLQMALSSFLMGVLRLSIDG